jgi:hypothetical protein
VGARDQKESECVCVKEIESRTPLNCSGFDFHCESANKCQPARWGYGGPMGIKCLRRVEYLAVQVRPRGDDSERFRDVRRGSWLLYSLRLIRDWPVL